MKKVLLTGLTATMLLTSSCATLFQGSVKNMAVKSMTPGADIYINGNLQGTDAVYVRLPRKTNHTVMVKKEGFDTKTIDIRKRTQVGWVLFDIFLNPFGIPVDAITGGWNTFDTDIITVELDQSK